MKTHTITTSNGNVYQFINESFSNSRNWGHKSQLFINNVYIEDDKRIYLNRTWESYQYQSVMKEIVWKLIAQEQKQAVDKYKSDNGIKRLSSEKRIEIESSVGTELKEILNKL